MWCFTSDLWTGNQKLCEMSVPVMSVPQTTIAVKMDIKAFQFKTTHTNVFQTLKGS